jgi:hypothetical protein
MFGPCDAARKLIASRPVLSEQRRGEALFVQNCPLCHVPSHQKQALGIQGPILKGMSGGDADEYFLRFFIQQEFLASDLIWNRIKSMTSSPT